jgi:hypothetical protein
MIVLLFLLLSLTSGSFSAPQLIFPSVASSSSSGLVGYSPIDVNDNNVKEMASFAANTLSQAIHSAHNLIVSRIVSAAQNQQVLSGTNNYNMELELRGGGISNDLSTKCRVVIYNQIWTNTRRLTDCSCCGSISTLGSSPSLVISASAAAL